MLLVRRRRYVIPGEVVIEGDHRANGNVIRINGKLISTKVGLAEVGQEGVRVIPLVGPYLPRVDDMVIGKVVEFSTFGWEVDISSCFLGFLHAQSVFGRDYSPSEHSLTEKLNVGDLIAAKIVSFDRTRDPLLSISEPGLGKIPEGEILKIAPTKVPRLIGKKGSMIRTIEIGTRCSLTIGQNGVVVAVGPPDGVLKAVEAVRLVEKDAHTADLSQKIQALLGEPQQG